MLNEEIRQQVDKRKSIIERLKSISKNVSSISAFDFNIAMVSTDTEPKVHIVNGGKMLTT